MPALHVSGAEMNVKNVQQSAPVCVYVYSHAAALLAASYADVKIPGFQ